MYVHIYIYTYVYIYIYTYIICPAFPIGCQVQLQLTFQEPTWASSEGQWMSCWHPYDTNGYKWWNPVYICPCWLLNTGIYIDMASNHQKWRALAWSSWNDESNRDHLMLGKMIFGEVLGYCGNAFLQGVIVRVYIRHTHIDKIIHREIIHPLVQWDGIGIFWMSHVGLSKDDGKLAHKIASLTEKMMKLSNLRIPYCKTSPFASRLMLT